MYAICTNDIVLDADILGAQAGGPLPRDYIEAEMNRRLTPSPQQEYLKRSETIYKKEYPTYKSLGQRLVDKLRGAHSMISSDADRSESPRSSHALTL